MGSEGNGFCGSADQAAPQNPALRGRVLFFRHGLHLPSDQRLQRLSGNDGPATNPGYAEPSGRDMGVKSCPSEAGRMAGFSDAVAQLRAIIIG